MNRIVSVSVPASSGNIGPGFDVLGLALDYRNELHVRLIDQKKGSPLVRVVGEGENSLPTDERNVIYQTMAWLFRKAKKNLPRLDVVCVNRIPLARGLGSSSAAYLSALLAANRLLGDVFKPQEILQFATELEGHPDNVVSAFLGGVQASGVYGTRVVSAALPIPKLKTVVAIPTFELSTKKARKILPKNISLKDAVWNLSAVALLPLAFGGQEDLLAEILNDRWHEPYRAKLIPGFFQVKKAALSAGAKGVILSGAGPTMLSFVKPKDSRRVAQAMKWAFLRAGVTCKTMQLEIDKRGARVQ
ncbi:MAG: Homoserine kinase [Elusimicrobia bacterium]|nr:Homoserine kinase [Elusimicrobiota bacterium]